MTCKGFRVRVWGSGLKARGEEFRVQGSQRATVTVLATGCQKGYFYHKGHSDLQTKSSKFRVLLAIFVGAWSGLRFGVSNGLHFSVGFRVGIES